jgi:hypothetical protein
MKKPRFDIRLLKEMIQMQSRQPISGIFSFTFHLLVVVSPLLTPGRLLNDSNESFL